MTFEGIVLAGRYRLLRPIGQGAMGVVYEAEDADGRRSLAVKILHPHLRGDRIAEARMRREALIAGSLGHDHLCGAIDAGTTPDGMPYLVMEQLHGETLRATLRREGRLPVARALRIAIQVLDALDAAHEAGVVHRDLKPANVFLSEVGETRDFVRILDFGVSKATDLAPDADATGAGSAAGTPHYMAPEQARGQRDQDRRVDVYAAGVLLYEMLTGVRPFEGESTNDVLIRITTETFDAPSKLVSEIPDGVERVVLRAMSRGREHRHPTARAMREALEAAGDRGAPDRTLPTVAAVSPTRRSRGWAGAFAALAVVAAVAAVTLGGWMRREEPAIAVERDRLDRPGPPPVAAAPATPTRLDPSPADDSADGVDLSRAPDPAPPRTARRARTRTAEPGFDFARDPVSSFPTDFAR